MQVCCHDSDIDATIIMMTESGDGSTAEERLKLVSRKLKGHSINCQEILSAKHPILVVQKDIASRIAFNVDISFDGHEAIHKSCMVRDRFERISCKRAFDLALLVKRWASKTQLKGNGCWTSHGWMLLVVMYFDPERRTKGHSVLGFFEWFVSSFQPDTRWVIGAGEKPVEFEQSNVAELANSSSNKANIHSKVKGAIRAMKAGALPWTAE